MHEWPILLTPLLVLPIVVLFRFVGCQSFTGTDGDPAPAPAPTGPPRYRDYIMGVPNNPGPVKNPGVVPNKADVIGYWRLIDAASSAVAHDEKGFQDGIYVTIPGGQGQDGFYDGQNSLVASDPLVKCRIFSGGYVVVPYKDGLFTEEFSIEAWINAQWAQTSLGTEHTLFFAGGHYMAPLDTLPDYHGFRLYADEQNRWQAGIFPTIGPLFTTPPLLPFGARTHVCMTVAKDTSTGLLTVTLYVDAKPTAIATIAFNSLPDGAPLLIGIINDQIDPTYPVQPDKPINSSIQEVVLYLKALSQDEIENHVNINR